MEAAGLALGVVSLTGTFTSIVQCFEYIQLGRHFGKDFDRAQIRIDALKLQLTRWGISVGIIPDTYTGRYRRVEVGKVVEEIASQLLTSILGDIREVEEKSAKYKAEYQVRQGSTPTDLAVLGPSDLGDRARILSLKAEALVKQRTKGISFVKRTKWAIYEKKILDQLLQGISDNMSRLEAIYKPVSDSQTELAGREVEEIEAGLSTESLELLHEAATDNNDEVLSQAVSEAIKARGHNHQWERTEVDEGVELNQGDRIAAGFTGRAPAGRIGHNFGVTVGKGKAKITQGDVYGFK